MSDDYDDIGAIRRRGRGARQEDPERDPRFLVDGAYGRVSPAQSNWGSRARLLNTKPNEVVKLIRIEGTGDSPWIVSVSTTITGAAIAGTGVRVSGNFGSGGSFNRVEFDAAPDQSIMLPGAAIDLDVGWDPIYQCNLGNSGGKATEVIVAGILPDSADVSAVACRGESIRGSATRTQFVDISAAGNWIVKIPPYANDLAVAVDLDANYPTITLLEFLTSDNAAALQVIVSFTGAQLLALKNAGGTIPVPGNAVAVRIAATAAVVPRLVWLLSL